MKERVRDCIATLKHARAAAAAVKLLLKSNEEGKDTGLFKLKISAKNYKYFLTHNFSMCFGCSKESSH